MAIFIPIASYLSYYRYKLFILPLLLLPSASLAQTWIQDWIKDNTSLCGGHYEPVPLNPTPDASKIMVKADESVFTPYGMSTVTGNVQIRLENRALNTNEAQIYLSPSTQKIERIVAYRGIEYLEPEFRIIGRQAELNFERSYFETRDLSYRLYERHARGTAHKALIYDNGTADLYGTTYTTCGPGSDTWMISARSLHLDRNKGRGQARNARIDVHHVPVFYMPYLDFPIDNRRKSGVLYPSMGTSTNSGRTFSLPIYWNIAPNYDATFTPRLLSKRGIELQTQARYLTTRSTGNVQANILPNDNLYREFRRSHRASSDLPPNDPRLTALDTGTHRIAISYQNLTQINAHMTGKIDYNYVGDDNYFLDLGNDLKTASTAQLEQTAELGYQGTAWTHLIRTQNIQTLHPFDDDILIESYRRLPQWTFEAYYPHLPGGWQLGLSGDVSRYTHKRDPFTDSLFTEGERYALRPMISYPLKATWGYIIPKLQWDFLYYDLKLGTFNQDTDKPQNPLRTVPLYSVDAGLFFDRPFRLLKHNYTQTLEPRLYYLKVPFRDQNLYPNFDSGLINFSYFQLFRDNRFSGRDRIGDANQITLALLTRLLNNQGKEMINVGFGEIVYFNKRKVTLCDSRTQENCSHIEDPSLSEHVSDLIGKMDIYWNDRWSTFGTLEYDPSRNHADKKSLSLHYRGPQRQVINLGYYWIRYDPAEINLLTGTSQSLRQSDISIVWPVHQHWALLGHAHYDFIQNRTVSLLGGLEYEGCCTAFQFVVTHYMRPTERTGDRRYTTSFIFQVMLKGLSNISPMGKEHQLSNAIPGYEKFTKREGWASPTVTSL